MLVDTSFCIDLFREASGIEGGPATHKLQSMGSLRLQMSLFVYSELLHGANASRSPEKELRRVENLAELIPVLLPDRSFAVRYGSAAAALQAEGSPIPQMDLLIGVHAASLGTPLLTRDRKHYQRISGLIVEGYE